MKSIQLFSRMALFFSTDDPFSLYSNYPSNPIYAYAYHHAVIYCHSMWFFVFPDRYAFLCMFTYILVGLLGFPVFASGGGLQYIMKPTFGFVLGFLACSTICAIAYKRKSPVSLERILSCRTHRTYQFLCSRKYLLLFFLSHLDEYPHSFMVIFNQRIFGFHHSRYINLFSCLQSRKNSTDTYQVTPATGRRFLFASFQMLHWH